MNIEIGKDVTSDSFNYDDNFDIIDVPSSTALFQLQDSLYDDETELFSMTSLGALVFLENRGSKYGSQNISGSFSDVFESHEENRLTLAYEKINYIPRAIVERFSETILTLDISHNYFSDLEFIKEFKYLTSLIADHNDVTSETVLPYMPSLELLWLNHCKIEELFPWARKLQQTCPNLKHLSLMGNVAAPSYLNGGTFYEYLQYRLFIISLFPKLVHLDDRPVTDSQREEAKRLYQRPFLERIVPRAISSLPPYLKVVGNAASNIFSNNSPFPQRQLKNDIV